MIFFIIFRRLLILCSPVLFCQSVVYEFTYDNRETPSNTNSEATIGKINPIAILSGLTALRF